MSKTLLTGRRENLIARYFLCALVVSLLNGCSAVPPPATQSARIATASVRIAPDVAIDGVPVGALTQNDAFNVVKSVVTTHFDTISFRLHDPIAGGSYHYSLRDFGGYFDIDTAVIQAASARSGTDIALPLRVDPNLVKLHVSRIADLWRVPVQEPKVRFGAGLERTVLPGHPGRHVDQTEALNVVLANLPTLSKPHVSDDIPFVITQPQVDPKKVMGLADTLVSYTTTFNTGNVQRTNNLLLAVHNINGTVVGPGEVFSYNDSVGPRTQQTGFQDAIIYVDNRMKKDVGGGICQASSTLYNCVLLANMPIVERHAHSLPVHYVPAGRDATVAWGGDDFRFRNNTSKPIIVRATATSGGTLTESLIGDHSALPHPSAKVAIDVTPATKYPDGFSVVSYRVVKEDGVLIAKEPLGVSFYHNLVGGIPH